MPSRSSPSVPADADYRIELAPEPERPADDTTPARYWRRAISINGLLLTVWAAVAYGPAAFLEFGRGDDYWFVFHNANGRSGSNATNLLEGGRLVGALLSRWMFPFVDTITELTHMRLAAMVALSLSGLVLSLMTLRLLDAPRSPVLVALAHLVGVVALITPAAPSAATWGVLALELWGLPLSLTAGLVATARSRVLGLPWQVAAGALVLLSAFTYQPTASACLLPVFLWSALRWVRREAPQWHRPVAVTTMLFASLALNVATVKLFHWAGSDRIGGHGLGESLLWFVAGYLPRTVDFGVPLSTQSLGLTTIVLVAGMLTPLTAGVRFLALPASVLGAWFVASVLVVPGELWATYRLAMTPQTMLWAGSLICVVLTLSELGVERRRQAVAIVAGAGVGAAALLGVAGYRAYAYLAAPNAVDWASVRCVVRQSAPLTSTTTLAVNPFSASTSPVLASDEYGITASSTEWALPYIAWLAAADVGKAEPGSVDALQLQVVERGIAGSDSLHFPQNICGARAP